MIFIRQTNDSNTKILNNLNEKCKPLEPPACEKKTKKKAKLHNYAAGNGAATIN